MSGKKEIFHKTENLLTKTEKSNSTNNTGKDIKNGEKERTEARNFMKNLFTPTEWVIDVLSSERGLFSTNLFNFV